MTWTHNICERDWIKRELNVNPNHQWEGQPDTGVTCKVCGDSEYDAMPTCLITMRRPVQVKGNGLDRCCFCGEFTFIGVFVREDPKNLRCDHGADDNTPNIEKEDAYE